MSDNTADNLPPDVSDWLPNILGPVELQDDGTPLPSRANLNFGPNLTKHVEDDGKTITIDGIAAPGGVTLPINVKIVDKSADYTLVSGTDFHVNVTANGTTQTLPAAPTDGDTYEVRSAPGVTGTIIDGHGHNFDDTNPTYAQNPGETTVVRFHGTTWRVC